MVICADCGYTEGFDCTCPNHSCALCSKPTSIAELELVGRGDGAKWACFRCASRLNAHR